MTAPGYKEISAAVLTWDLLILWNENECLQSGKQYVEAYIAYLPIIEQSASSCQTYFLSEAGVKLLIPNELRLALKRASCSDRLFLGRPAIPSSPGQRHSSWKFRRSTNQNDAIFSIIRHYAITTNWFNTGSSLCGTALFQAQSSMMAQQNEPSILLNQSENDLVFTIIGHRRQVRWYWA